MSEEPVKVEWTHRKNGREMVDDENGCAQSGG